MSILTPLEFKKGLIPTLKDLKQTPIFLQTLYKQNKEDILSILIYGSVPRGDFTITSDIDCLMILKDFKKRKTLNQKINEYQNKTHVDINLKPINSQTIEQLKIQPISNPAFAQHLAQYTNKGILFGQNPFEIMNINQASHIIKKDAKDSFEFRLNRIENKAFYSNNKERCKLLTQIVQEPWHLARQFIQWHKPLHFTNQNVDDTKIHLEEKLLQILKEKEVEDNFSNFLETSKKLKNWYLKNLEERQKTKNSNHEKITKYKNLLDIIELQYNNYIEFYHFLYKNLN